MYQTDLNNITLFNAPEEYDYDELGEGHKDISRWWNHRLP